MSELATTGKKSLVSSMAARYEMEPQAFISAIKASVIKGECSNEQFAAFLMVAKEYDLNPLTKEIYAFPDRGGITPIVSIDGWMKLINSHPQFDGMDFKDEWAGNSLLAITCTIYRKDRTRPTAVTEYMAECARGTEPWKKWPARMLRHKAAIQCARYAFGFAGIIDPDEADRVAPIDITPPSPSAVEAPTARDVVDVEPESEDVPPPPPTDEEKDYGPYTSLGEYLEGLNEALTRCDDDADIETIWSEFDPLAMLEGDDDAQEIAKQMKARHLVRVETKQ